MKLHKELVSCQLGDGHAKFCANKLMPFASSMQERFVTLHGPVENDEFSNEHVCVIGDVHENVEPLHRSIQKQTDDATKSWEALTDALTNSPGFLGTVASWKTFQYEGSELQLFSEEFGKPSDSHPWMCMLRCGSQRNFQQNAGTHARLRGGPAFGHVFAGARHASAELLELGHRNQCRASVLGECGRPKTSWRSTVSC